VKKVIGMVVLGIGGLAAAIALTVGALALAGDEVGSVVQPSLGPSGSGSPSRATSPSRGDDEPALTPSPSVDDHGGGTGSDDLSGSDNSGPGSDSSGSGSDGSGSGSDSSGSGSDEPESPDDD
jgi:hypothetical protein